MNIKHFILLLFEFKLKIKNVIDSSDIHECIQNYSLNHAHPVVLT